MGTAMAIVFGFGFLFGNLVAIGIEHYFLSRLLKIDAEADKILGEALGATSKGLEGVAEALKDVQAVYSDVDASFRAVGEALGQLDGNEEMRHQEIKEALQPKRGDASGGGRKPRADKGVPRKPRSTDTTVAPIVVETTGVEVQS